MTVKAAVEQLCVASPLQHLFTNPNNKQLLECEEQMDSRVC